MYFLGDFCHSIVHIRAGFTGVLLLGRFIIMSSSKLDTSEKLYALVQNSDNMSFQNEIIIVFNLIYASRQIDK